MFISVRERRKQAILTRIIIIKKNTRVVIVKFKPEVTEEIKAQAIKDVVALKDTIPEIKIASAGKNFTDRGKGYEYGWVIEVESKEVSNSTFIYMMMLKQAFS